MSAASIDDVLRDAKLVVTCGPGGVGKTTTAAALGLAAARTGRRVLVITIDPARRLADALGVAAAAGNEPHLVEGAVDGPGSFSALMLDAEQTFDDLIRQRAGAGAEALLHNRVYRGIAGSMAGAQEYMAIERLHQLHHSGDYDLVVIDTPPSRHAIDVLTAPDRLVLFLSHPIYRALAIPTRSFARLTSAASAAFLWTVKRLAGPKIIQELIEFFRALSGMEAGLRTRAAEMSALLRDERTAFVLVSSPRAEAIDEATFLTEALSDGGFHLGAVVVNMVHPVPAPLSAALTRAFDKGQVAGPLAEQIAYHHELLALAAAERTEVQSLECLAAGVPVREIELLDHDVHDVAALTELGELLTGT
ncbi:MAG: ArsA-related P-loop ATPase [Ilumatobacteraceae bacterium]